MPSKDTATLTIGECRFSNMSDSLHPCNNIVEQKWDYGLDSHFNSGLWCQ